MVHAAEMILALCKLEQKASASVCVCVREEAYITECTRQWERLISSFLCFPRFSSSPDARKPGGSAAEGGGGAAYTSPSTQPGGQRVRRGGRPALWRGEEVPRAAGATEETAEQLDGLARDPPIQPRCGG